MKGDRAFGAVSANPAYKVGTKLVRWECGEFVNDWLEKQTMVLIKEIKFSSYGFGGELECNSLCVVIVYEV
jgi:hypothetical protein